MIPNRGHFSVFNSLGLSTVYYTGTTDFTLSQTASTSVAMTTQAPVSLPPPGLLHLLRVEGSHGHSSLSYLSLDLNLTHLVQPCHFKGHPHPRLSCLFLQHCPCLKKTCMVVKSTDSTVRLPRIGSQLSHLLHFPGGSDGKASVYSSGDPGSISGSGRSPGEGSGNPLQYYCLENPMDGGAWWATLH